MNRVKEIRIQRGLSQNKLACLTNGVVSQGDVSKVESGYWRRPYPKIRKALSKALEMPETELFPNDSEGEAE